ncbi:hypothetical protein [Streptomyces chartreusis]|uniref:Uncharacterized protein n=1 Tax=Streptomyces chartreusis TaxID=1969 RepID=A0A7I0NSF6_STRCX|nr:hypothetical protein [Streptomyces chartreusis]QKZ15999.1 hypothetical protein HUT05_00440 [Streptomyces chartreusis]
MRTSDGTLYATTRGTVRPVRDEDRPRLKALPIERTSTRQRPDTPIVYIRAGYQPDPEPPHIPQGHITPSAASTPTLP